MSRRWLHPVTVLLGAEVASLGLVLASLLSQSCPPACSLGVFGVKASELCQAIALGVAQSLIT